MRRRTLTRDIDPGPGTVPSEFRCRFGAVVGPRAEWARGALVGENGPHRSEAPRNGLPGAAVGRTPGDHLAFGHGPRFCLGAQPARLRMREMVAAVLDRLGEVQLPGEPRRSRSDLENGLRHLPIRWRPLGR